MAATWHVQHESRPRFCTYISDRGAIFGAVPVEPSGPDDRLGALEAARTSCATPPHDVPVRGIRSLSCVEHHPSGNHAIGNTIDQETHWEIVIPVTGSDAEAVPQLRAVDALLGAVGSSPAGSATGHA